MNNFLLTTVALIAFSAPSWADPTADARDGDGDHFGIASDNGDGGFHDKDNGDNHDGNQGGSSGNDNNNIRNGEPERIGSTASTSLSGTGSVTPDNRRNRRHHHPKPTPTPTPTPAPTNGTTLLKEFEAIDTSNNNKMHPEFNPVPGSPLLAIVPPTSNTMESGPNVRVISNVLGTGKSASGVNAQTASANASAWLYLFGQFTDHDLGLAEVPASNPSANITVAPGDPDLPNGGTIPFTRATIDPATLTQVNAAAGFLNLSQVYGQTQAIANSLRHPTKPGMLNYTHNPDNTSDSEYWLPVENDQFVSGDPRVMENLELTAVTTLFMRNHNRLVKMFQKEHPEWTSDELYNMARQVNISMYQHIIYNEYLPLLIGNVIPADIPYDPNVNAQLTQEFSVAAYRIHTIISNCIAGIDNNGNTTFNVPTSETFSFTATKDYALGVNHVIRHVFYDVAQHFDPYLVTSLRDNLNVALPDTSVIDLIDLGAIDQQRSRDLGLPTLNQVRVAMGLPAYTSFSQISSDTVIQQHLQEVYGNVNAVELFFGGMSEDIVPGANVGPTFQAIIADQFTRLRQGDRFYWKNVPFDTTTKAMIDATTIKSLALANTTTTLSLQDKGFMKNPKAGSGSGSGAASPSVASTISPKDKRIHPRFVPGPWNNN